MSLQILCLHVSSVAVSWVGHASGRYIGSDVVCEQRFFRFTRVSEYVCRGGADDEAGQTSAASLAQSTVGVRSRQPTKASATFFLRVVPRHICMLIPKTHLPTSRQRHRSAFVSMETLHRVLFVLMSHVLGVLSDEESTAFLRQRSHQSDDAVPLAAVGRRHD